MPKRAGSHPAALVCPEWIWLNQSNVHVAKDRGWFKTYTPFTSTVNDSIFTSGHALQVLGIGTVVIPTKRSPNRSGVASHGSLRLRQVLHVPDFICNVIGGQSLVEDDGYMVDTSSSTSTGRIKDHDGKSVAYFDHRHKLFAVRVRHAREGPKLGPYVLQEGVTYLLSCRWEPSEQRKWLEHQISNLGPDLSDLALPRPTVASPESHNNSPRAGSPHVTNTNPPYTDAEKAFLKSNWGNEYRFLLQHGLQIFKDEHRADGRTILPRLDQETTEDEDSELEFVGHQADFKFSHKHLDWIEEHYGNSETFMVSYGLKWYNDDDVEEAKTLVESFLSEE